MSHDYTDPILLTAVCTFALDLFECDELRTNQDVMQPYYDEMQSMMHLIPYMGFEKYPQLLQMTRKYHNINQPSKRVNEAGSREEEQITHLDQNQSTSMDEHKMLQMLED